jgi:hypothetical protein
MSDAEHPDVILDSPNGPILLATWTGTAYRCTACFGEHPTAEEADQHADVHIVRA